MLTIANATGAGTTLDSDHSLDVPRYWPIVMRLALVSFMTTAWFLSRSYTATMYLVLGLATAAVALQRGANKSHDRGRWVISTVILEVLMIVLIYGLVRLRH